MRISAIVPVYNGGEQLLRCLDALASSSRLPDEIVVVDDGSTDHATQSAASLGFRLTRLDDGPHGPAKARNHGVAATLAPDILVFIDADVLITRNTIALVADYFARHPEVAAIFGSYDNDPPEKNIASLYKNLLHHHTHQTSGREASTFWAGCGAIRSDAFAAVGGFDEGYRQPTIEDIELGTRLRAAGYQVHLCPEIQVKHLKRWSLLGMIKTDIVCRALPWSRLVISQGRFPNELNLSVAHRVRAGIAVACVLLLLASVFFPVALVPAAGCGALFVSLNWRLLEFFAQRGGAAFGAGAGALHFFYYLYSSATLVWVAAEVIVNRVRAPINRVLTRPER